MVSHRHTQRHTRSLTYTHKQRHAGDEGEIFSKSFSFALASPCLSHLDPSLLPSPWSLPLISSAGTQILDRQAGLIARGVEIAQGSEENSGVRAGQCCAET